MSQQKRKGILDALIDKDGIKTEVTLTVTNTTAIKIALTLLISGISVLLIAHLLKNAFPNAQLASIESELLEIKHLLKK